MDPIRNPFTPGAGSPPPELAGRDAVLDEAKVALQRIRTGRFSKSLILVGLRGVGKTVLLDRMKLDAEELGALTIRIEAPEGRSLPALLAPHLRTALLTLSKIEKAKELAMRGLRALVGFAKGLKVKFADIEVGYDAEPEPGLADNGDLEADLTSLLEAAGKAAAAAEKPLAIYIDELQYVAEEQLAALITALHRCSQLTLPVILIGAGLPQLRGQMGSAKSYAERLFDYPEIGPLSPDAASAALEVPAGREGVEFTPGALAAILLKTHRYAYFLQEWGKHTWAIAEASPITESDVESATEVALAALDQSFFLVRFDRLTPAEKRYVRAMGELGPGPHRTGQIAEVLGKQVSALGPVRANLIAKGMIWSPAHGDTAFTVPLFDDFIRRMMPGTDWKNR
jgi:hypothetical protein